LLLVKGLKTKMTKTDFSDRMLSLGLARVSEAAALESADLIGRGDEKAADQAAVNAMRDQLNKLDIAGVGGDWRRRAR
jgi:fructose-1,6-bisphosphatase II / sedoheptulose-1,7-bisphosphatase